MQASADYGSFESTLEKFVNTLEWTISEVANIEQDSAAPTASQNNTPPQMGGPGDMGMMV